MHLRWGNAFACSVLSRWEENEEEAFRFAGLAANQHERDGFSFLGFCFQNGLGGCEIDLNSENSLIAAELGRVSAAANYGLLLGESDPCCWLWLGRAALLGLPDFFLWSFPKHVEEFFSGAGNATVVFVIGCALKGNIDMEKKRIFGSDYNFISLIDPANQAVSFYSSQIKSARLAIDTWTLVATRLRLIKDMRMFIGKMIWEGRFEANYLLENDPAPRASPAQKRSRK